MVEPSQAVVANALGYTSIGFWLFAQAPQVIKNARLKSCEGLALPFLANWLLGDITNLVGCVLTDQLPFQTYLAVYFCVIDFTLVGQYYYYRPNQTPQPIYRTSSHLYTSSPHQSLLIHTAPVYSTHPHGRARSSSSVPRHAVPPFSAGSSSTIRPGNKRASDSFYPGETSTSAQSSIYRGRDDLPLIQGNPARDGSYQAIYEAALDVARAAERAEHRRQQSQSRSRPGRNRVESGKRKHRSSAHSGMPDVNEDAVSPVLGSRSAMFDSFHSDMSALTDHSASSSTAARQRQETMSMSTPALLVGRGRSLQRTATGMPMNVPTPPGEEDGDEISGLPGESGRGMVQMRERSSRSKSRSISLARGSSGRGSGRRAAGVAFMSLGLLAGWNGLGRGAKMRNTSQEGGIVLLSGEAISRGSEPLRHPLNLLAASSSHTRPLPPASPISYILVDHPTHGHPEHPGDEPPDYKRIIGRISAWACTTLYLTSRLPQIWKNFERKSVEGLSILLFLFAFCGNVAYVASIVFNPSASGDPSEANQYLLEALPYLLGSGGTLVFDLTIMLQSLFYGPSPPIPQTTIERSSFRKPLFRRRIRWAEEGRPVTAAPVMAVGERQPLMSASAGSETVHHVQTDSSA